MFVHYIRAFLLHMTYANVRDVFYAPPGILNHYSGKPSPVIWPCVTFLVWHMLANQPHLEWHVSHLKTHTL